MKKTRVRSLVLGFAAAALALSFVGGAWAQSQILKAEIPFNFYIGSKLMPAGTYTVRPNSNGAIYIGNNTDGSFLLTIPVGNPSVRNSLVFNRYGDVAFLTRLQWAGSVSRAVPESKLEKEARERNSTPVQLAVTPKK